MLDLILANIIGFSYGTVLGDTIARLYPTEIGGMVLDGNINPNDYWFQL